MHACIHTLLYSFNAQQVNAPTNTLFARRTTIVRGRAPSCASLWIAESLWAPLPPSAASNRHDVIS